MNSVTHDDPFESDVAMVVSEQLKWAGTPVQFEAFQHVPFPTTALPEVLEQMTEQVADVTQTSSDAAGAAILAMLSAAAAKKFNVRLVEGEGWQEKNNLYVIIAMPSGERKSAVYSHVAKPLIEFEKLIGDPAFRTEHGIRAQRYITDDVTPQALIQLLSENDERMALLSTEGGLFENLNYKHYGNQAKLDVFLRAFTGDRMVIDRKNAPKIVLNDPTLTMCVFVQPSILQALPERYTDQGFMGRFLYVLPPSKRGYRSIDIKSIPDHVFQGYRELIHHIMKFEPAAPVELTLTEGALTKLQAFRSEFEPKLRSGEELSHDFLSSWTDRLPGQVIRIASLLHVSEQAMYEIPFDDAFDRAIPEDTMDKAIMLGRYFIEHAKAAFGCFQSSHVIEDAKYLLDVLKRKGIPRYKRQQLWAAVKGKFGTSEKFDGALVVLAERGYIRADITKSLRGRNGMSIECHPSIIDRPLEVRAPVSLPRTTKERELDAK